MKRWHTILIGVGVSAVALFLAFRKADFGQVVEALRTARYGYLVVAFVATCLLTWMRGLRWSVLTRGRLSIADGFWLFNVGFLFNNLLPARLGEIVRAMLAGRRPQMHLTSALSSVVVERLFDMVAVVVVLGITLLGLDLPGWATTAGGLMGGGALVGIGVLAYAAKRPVGALQLGTRLLALAPGFDEERASALLHPFVDGLAGVSDGRVFAAGLALSVLAWIGSAVIAWVGMLAFWPRLPLIMGFLVVAAAGMGLTVPSAPSGVGPFHAAVIGALIAVGYEADVSRSYAFVLHAISFATTTLLGIIGLLREGVGFGEMVRAAQSLQEHSRPAEQASLEVP